MEFITKEMLKSDYEFQMKLDQKITIPNPIHEADEYLYKKFDYKNFNNSNYIVIRPPSVKKDEFAMDFATLSKSSKAGLIQKKIRFSKTKEQSEKLLIDKNNLNIKAVKKIPNGANKQSLTEETVTKGDNSLSSFLNESSNSSFSLECSTLLDDSPLLSVHSLRMRKLKSKRKNLRFFNKKEFPKGYNPKLLTTADCEKNFYFVS